MKKTVVFAAILLAAGAALAYAQMNHNDHMSNEAHEEHSGHSANMDHSAHGHEAATEADRKMMTLTEPGQGAFAALAEVVKVLEADPGTDWTKVDLKALREHLVDMDRLVTHAVVEETELPDGIAALATGDDKTLETLKRMVPAHAGQLAADDRWKVETAAKDGGVELRVTSDDPAVTARIKGLGFFGLMASQDHHRAHHMMMARGESPHQH